MSSAGTPGAARTFPELIRFAAASHGDAVAITLETEAGRESVTFADLDRQSAAFARGLLARGVGKGARVGFIFGNGPGFAIALAAIARIGAVAVPISTMLRAGELVRVLRQSDVQGLIVQRTMLGKDLVARLTEALPELIGQACGALRLPRVPYLRWIVSSGEGLPAAAEAMGWLTDAGAELGEDLLLEVESEVHPTDQMIEIYTSGSMALPKGVRHLHGAVMARSHWLAEMLGVQAGEERPAQLPMFWVGGLMLYLLPGWERGAVTTCTERTLSNSRFAMGSVLAEEDLERIKGPQPWWGLGMSETLGPYGWGDEFRVPGRPVCAPMDHFAPGYDIRIADEDGRAVGDGEIGEMQVRGPAVATGLHKIDRAEHYTPDGYLRTGDLCLVEDRADGRRIHFVGRGGDMIKVSGSNVSPAEVEMELQALDGVHSAYVVGLPDRERGALLVAALVPRDGAVLDMAAIEARLRGSLSGYKVPRAWVELARDEVPLLHSNKVARKEIARIVAERLSENAV
ncbi:acyl-CoA synthetase (AMP-forming)/AMP-acid ligase II [Novosphingobium sp. PhB55]|uniref:class I adenylate-forming enzyme family protein n=1 Tax=Novosphingobium sp. PhB55 TaxID=2485106 RepID=UPI0010D9109C|nr:class I adenylate-forming enzyme family protein [Novosphingobium sp. PhB55]TDW63228.1 acyl-CoA synthetase (AMP-forming)/AMP-acid ligase II [Novosphingobium sp. PhB55]